jgi:hypothetical protein
MDSPRDSIQTDAVTAPPQEAHVLTIPQCENVHW